MRLFRILLLSFILIGNKALAAGFTVDTHSASGLANSYAGVSAGAHDIGDSFYNPAILSDISSSNLILSAAYIKLDIDPDNTTGNFHDSSAVNGSRSGDAGVDAVIPAFFYATPLNDKVTAGISITTPFGLATKYDQNWAGRYHAVESSLETINISPALSYKVSNKFSLGASFQAQHMKATLTKMVDVASHPLVSATPGTMDSLGKAKGRDWGYGFGLGAKYKINNRLEAGIGYRSKIEHKLEGKTQIYSSTLGHPISDFNALLTTPETLTFGFKYAFSNKLELVQDTSWTRWSRVQDLKVSAIENTTLSESTSMKWKDSWKYAVGLNWKKNDKLLLRSGLAYEEGAVDKLRNPRLPTGDKIWTSIGLEYSIDKDTKLDLTYLHEFFTKTKSSVGNTDPGVPVSSLDSEYKTSVDVIAIGVKWEF